MKTVPAIIKYKVKVKSMQDGREYIDYKKTITRTDCNLKPCDHSLYNSDLFRQVLARGHNAAVNNKSWTYLDSLPESVTVDNSSFLATVTVSVQI